MTEDCDFKDSSHGRVEIVSGRRVLVATVDHLRVHVRVLEPRDGGGFLAEVCSMPGCMSDGESPDEALENVKGAIIEWRESEKRRQEDEAVQMICGIGGIFG